MGTPPSLTLILVITAIWLDFSPATVQGRYRDRNQAAVLAIFLVALDFNGSVNDVSLCNLETQWPKIAWSRPIGVANSLVCSKYMFTHVVPLSQRRTKSTTGSNGCHCLPWQGDVSQAKQTSLDWTTTKKHRKKRAVRLFSWWHEHLPYWWFKTSPAAQTPISKHTHTHQY